MNFVYRILDPIGKTKFSVKFDNTLKFDQSHPSCEEWWLLWLVKFQGRVEFDAENSLWDRVPDVAKAELLRIPSWGSSHSAGGKVSTSVRACCTGASSPSREASRAGDASGKTTSTFGSAHLTSTLRSAQVAELVFGVGKGPKANKGHQGD